ncbi:ammonium transporter [Luteolibacter marinus]|uniref:ammonium transporter n=1 Tax=Luteolibacter marinus TaxID=2776705 RepID=UPI001867D431|nr:ammonium transporter [Luteolibacter marinus]
MKTIHASLPRALAVLAAMTLPAAAQESAPALPDTGDTAWMLTSTVLVLLMTLPGLALFYGGLVRGKNVLSILVQCFAMAALMSVIWIVFGASFATGSSDNAFIGDSSKVMLKHLTPELLNGTIPESVWLTFQMTFIIITPALIVGAFAERMKFSAMLIFTTIWTILSYLPIWHMAWGGGLFHHWNVLDFAGGTVVHINAGIAGLVACIMLGKRRGFPGAGLVPHNVPFAVMGAGLLWVGWFGFNAGSALGANASAGMAMISTHAACAMAALVWMFVEWLVHGKPTAVGIATGAVAGLVAITPAAGSTTVAGALVIGAISSGVCYFTATKMKNALGYDDSLDVFGVHGVGGIVGAILTGVFIRPDALPEGMTVATQTWAQTKSVIVTIAWSAVASVVALMIAKVTVGLRVPEEEETGGLDRSSHGEEAYNTES